MTKKGKLVRVDKEWEKEMRILTKQRFQRGLIKNCKPKDLGLPRATTRLLRCPSWGQLKLEYLNMKERDDE